MRRTLQTIVVPVSGGKDSQAVLRWAIAKHGKSRLRVLHQNTGYDHPLTYEHLDYMGKRYGVVIEHTKASKYKDIFDFIKQVGYFPNNKARGCTERLKQAPFGAWLISNNFTVPGACHIYMGMRGTDESPARTGKYGELNADDIFTLPELGSFYTKGKFGNVKISLPIVQWTTAQTFKYLADAGDKVNPLYAKGHGRVGCYPCLLSNQKEWLLAVRDPVGVQHIDELLKIERDFAAHPTGKRLIRIHQSRDIERLRKTGSFKGQADLMETECGWCSI